MATATNEALRPSEILTRKGLARTSQEDEIRTASQNPEARDSGEQSFHGIRIGEIGLLLSDDISVEVLNEVKVCELPQAPAYLFGISTLRGSVIPIFDIRRPFQDINNESTRMYFVAVTFSDGDAGLVCDQLPTTVHLGPENRLKSAPPLPIGVGAYASEAYQRDRLWLKLDLRGFLGSLLKDRRKG